MKLLFTNDWLRKKIEAEPEGVECEAGASCSECKFAFGPLFLACGNARSEFFESAVHPLGYCPEFQPEPRKK